MVTKTDPNAKPRERLSRERVIDALNDHVTADERVDSVMVLVADGLTFVRRR